MTTLIEKWRMTFQVADDDKDDKTLEVATVRHKTNGRVSASFSSGRSQRWADQQTYMFDVAGITPLSVERLDDYQVQLSHDPKGDDKFRFYFVLEGFAENGKKLYENRWGKINFGGGPSQQSFDL